MRVYPDGSTDPSFGNGGEVFTSFSSGEDIAKSMKIQKDGKILLGGLANGGNTFAIARYNTDGSLDSTFSDDGKDTAGVGFSADWGPALLLQNNGKIDIVGTDYHDSARYCSIVQYTASGAIDTSYNFDNMAVNATINSGALQSDGKILAGGIVGPDVTTGYDFIIARFNQDGTLDNSFSFDGKVTTDFLFADDLYKVAVQSDGKILATGYCFSGAYYQVVLARYLPDGTLDDQFADNGKFYYVPPDYGTHVMYSILEQPDHKILMAGTGYDGVSHVDMEFYRLNDDGTMDSTFGTNGISLPPNQRGNQAYDLAIQPDGKILACGFDIPKDYNYDMMVMRLISGYIPSVISDSKLASSFAVYPNPFIRKLTVKNSDYGKDNTRLQLYSMDGRLIYSCILIRTGQTVDPGNIPSGTYIARIENSKVVFSEVIVKR